MKLKCTAATGADLVSTRAGAEPFVFARAAQRNTVTLRVTVSSTPGPRTRNFAT